MEDVHIIHNHNWQTSGGWPETQSGQCTIGGIYGSGAVKSGYSIKNVYVETAASCAIGLEISNSAYSRHPTVGYGGEATNCVGSFNDFGESVRGAKRLADPSASFDTISILSSSNPYKNILPFDSLRLPQQLRISSSTMPSRPAAGTETTSLASRARPAAAQATSSARSTWPYPPQSRGSP